MMAQMKAMTQNLISELISFLPACTINEKRYKKSDFYSPKVPSYLLVLSVWSNMSNYVVKYYTFCLDAGIIIFHIVILGSNVQFQTSIHILFQIE